MNKIGQDVQSGGGPPHMSETGAGIHLKHDDELLSALHTQGLLIILDLNLTRKRNAQVIHVNRYLY